MILSGNSLKNLLVVKYLKWLLISAVSMERLRRNGSSLNYLSLQKSPILLLIRNWHLRNKMRLYLNYLLYLRPFPYVE